MLITGSYFVIGLLLLSSVNMKRGGKAALETNSSAASVA
jgi:hypothetical protein